jgi:hypothetical protein
MKKFLLIFLVMLFGFSGCAHRHGSINEDIERPYYTAVPIVNALNRPAGAEQLLM